MTKRDAAADLALCEAATPGPWESFKSAHNELNGMPWGWIDARSNGRQLWVWSGSQNQNWENDNRFVTIAREALPYWIKQAVEAERLLESHGPEGRNYANAEFVEMRSRAQAAEARVAELEAEVKRLKARWNELKERIEAAFEVSDSLTKSVVYDWMLQTMRRIEEK